MRNCCSAVRAIAIFEALSAFDDSFAAEAGFRSADRRGKNQSKEYRDAFCAPDNRGRPMEKDKTQGIGARRFEDAFVRALKAVSAWLQAPNSDDDDYPSKGKDADGHAPHETIPRLFETSLLLGSYPRVPRQHECARLGRSCGDVPCDSRLTALDARRVDRGCAEPGCGLVDVRGHAQEPVPYADAPH